MLLEYTTQSFRNILLGLKDKAGGGVFVPLGDLFDNLSKDKTCAEIVRVLDERDIRERKVNLKKMVAASFTEAFKIGSSKVEPYHLLLALLLRFFPVDYAQAKSLFLFKKASQKPRTSLDTSQTGYFITDVTRLAYEKRLPKIIGRRKETDFILTTFLQREKNTPLIVGDSGVGKTSLVYGLAQRIVDWDVPRSFIGADVFMIDLLALSGNLSVLKDGLEQTLSRVLMKYAKPNTKTIIFFDDLHLINPSLILSFSPIPLRFADSANDLPVHVIACANESYTNRFLEGPLTDLWSSIKLKELPENTTYKILEDKINQDPYYHSLTVSGRVLRSIVEKSYRTSSARLNPGRAVDSLNALFARAIAASERISKEELEEKRRLENLERRLRKAVLESSIKKSVQNAERLEREYARVDAIIKRPAVRVKITQKTINDFFSEEFDYGFDKAGGEDSKSSGARYRRSLVNLEKLIDRKIKGQKKATRALAVAVRRMEGNILSSRRRPAGSFLFLGPTGVGKTETAKVLSEVLKDYYKLRTPNFIRLDMSDFMERHTVSRLVGSPPGYVGYDDGGQLTDFISSNPRSIILFDEIEKAHKDVLNILLQVMEEGELTDGSGAVVSFREAMIILTSNIGSELLQRKEIGFGERRDVAYEDTLMDAAKKYLKAEFVNRLDEVIVFRRLGKADLEDIIDLHLNPIRESLKSRGITFRVAKSAKEAILKKGNFKSYGAREIRRIVERDILDKINLAIFEGRLKKGSKITFGKEVVIS